MSGALRRAAWCLTVTLLPVLLLALVGRTLLRPSEATAKEVESVEVIPVQGKVYMLQFPNEEANIGVLPGPDGVLLVDSQLPGEVESVIKGVREITTEEIRFIITTHVHIPNYGGNEVLAGMGATIVAHENVRSRMFRPRHTPRRGGVFFSPAPVAARPILTFSDSVTFHMNGEEVRVFLVPRAHTDGDSFVYFVDSDVLHTGSVFRNNMYPIIDVYNGGTVAGMIEALETGIVLSGPNTKVILGKGKGLYGPGRNHRGVGDACGHPRHGHQNDRERDALGGGARRETHCRSTTNSLDKSPAEPRRTWCPSSTTKPAVGPLCPDATPNQLA